MKMESKYKLLRDVGFTPKQAVTLDTLLNEKTTPEAYRGDLVITPSQGFDGADVLLVSVVVALIASVLWSGYSLLAYIF